MPSKVTQTLTTALLTLVLGSWQLSAKAQENLAGVRVVRAYGQEEAEIRGFDAPNREYINRNLRLIYFWSLFMPLL